MNIVQTSIKNWKTTSAGLLVAGQAIVHLVFIAKSGKMAEGDWMDALTHVFVGIGLIAAGDADKSVDDKPANPQPPKP